MFQKRLKLAVHVGSGSKDLESDGCLKALALKVPFAYMYMYISIHMRKNVCCRPAVHVHKYVLVVCLEAG